MYQLLRSFFFLFDAERVHYFAMNLFRLFCSIPLLRNFLAARFQPGGHIPVKLFGLYFSNPVGLVAGFDKNAKYLRELR